MDEVQYNHLPADKANELPNSEIELMGSLRSLLLYSSSSATKPSQQSHDRLELFVEGNVQET